MSYVPKYGVSNANAAKWFSEVVEHIGPGPVNLEPYKLYDVYTSVPQKILNLPSDLPGVGKYYVGVRFATVPGSGVFVLSVRDVFSGGSEVYQLTASGETVWFAWAPNGVWVISAKCSPQYQWIWANAAERQAAKAQVSSASHQGKVGFQSDIQLEYEWATSEWSEKDPKYVFPLIESRASGGDTALYNMHGSVYVIFGTALAVPNYIGAGSFFQSIQRLALDMVGGTAPGSYAAWRGSLGASMGNNPEVSLRWDIVFVVNSTTPNWRWFVGMGRQDSIAAGNGDPATFRQIVGVGRSLGPDVTLFHNDETGNATQVSLGSSFPALVANTPYRLQIKNVNGASYRWQLTHLATKAVISGTIISEMPPLGINVVPWLYYSNNTDTGTPSIHYSSVRMWQSYR